MSTARWLRCVALGCVIGAHLASVEARFGPIRGSSIVVPLLMCALYGVALFFDRSSRP